MNIVKELETVKDEPDVKQEMMETETADPEQSPDDQVFKQEAETSMECVNSIVNEDPVDESLEVKSYFLDYITTTTIRIPNYP